ncbi:MAG: helix-turn-helix domain-containing protein [Anaerolineae bacterium]|nr:helix-turn-helix domain-containing protein [Anaerolineae bacterium]
MADGDLQTLGMLLQQTREEHALSFEEVEEQTRIRVKFLRALEKGDVSILPSVAHAKGFLRNYAQFLRLDANAIVAQFVELTGTETSSVTTTTAAPMSAPPSPPAASPVPTIPAFEQAPPPESVPAPIAASPAAPPTQRMRTARIEPGQQVGPTGPLGARQEQTVKDTGTGQFKKPQAASGRVFRSNWIIGAVLAIGMIAIVGWAITQLSAISGDELIPTKQVSIAIETTATDEESGSIPINQPTMALSPTTGIPILDRVLISMTVTRRTWVRIIVDGEIAYEGQAVPGNLLQYTGQQSIVVIAGNGAGLDVTYNGQDIGQLGDQGEAVERIFTPSGQATPTATATLTPTSTNVPTATPRVSPTLPPQR